MFVFLIFLFMLETQDDILSAHFRLRINVEIIFSREEEVEELIMKNYSIRKGEMKPDTDMAMTPTMIMPGFSCVPFDCFYAGDWTVDSNSVQYHYLYTHCQFIP